MEQGKLLIPDFNLHLADPNKKESPSTIAYNKKKEEERKLLEEDYKQQLKEFAEDKSYYHLYDNFTPFSSPGAQVVRKVLVKIFKFKPKVATNLLGKTELWLPSQLNGELKPQSVAVNEKVYNIVKVIKIGIGVEESPFVKVDNLYTIPVDDVIGDDWNPEFTFFMKTMVTQGKEGGHVKLPEGMRQRIPKLERNWDKYKFGLPTRLGDPTEDDRLIYLIPDMKLEALITL